MGSIGDLTCFSFYVTKNLTTGEGGMVTTDNVEWADKIRVLGLHGMDKDAYKRFSDSGYKHYQVVAPGYKYNMTDIQAALGIHQLRRIERPGSGTRFGTTTSRRFEIYRFSFLHRTNLISATPVISTPLWCVKPNAGKVATNCLMASTSAKLAAEFTTPPFICIPTIVKAWGSVRAPTRMQSGSETALFSLPLSAKLTDQDAEDVVDALHEILAN